MIKPNPAQQSYFYNLVKTLCKKIMKLEDTQPHTLYEHLMKNRRIFDENLDEPTKQQLIIFLGIHNSRRKYPDSKQIVFNLLKQTTKSQDQEDLNQTAIALSNLAIYDDEILTSVHEQLKNTKNPDIKIILNILWCFQKLNYKYDKLTFHNHIQTKQLEFNNYQSLIWLLSNEQPIDYNLVNIILEKYLEFKKKEQSIHFTPKISHQLVQTMFNLYPGLINQKLDTLKDYLKADSQFNQLQEDYIIAMNVLTRSKQEVISSNYEFSYFHKNFKSKYQDPLKNSFVYCLTPHTQAGNTSQFEKNIQSVLEEMGISFLKNQNMSIYEIDFLIGSQIIEANGHQHFIWDTNSEQVSYTLNHKIKMKHLKELGFNDIIMLDSKEWAKLDPHQKQLDHIRSLLVR